MQTESPRFTFFLASIAALTSISIDISLPAMPAIEREFGLLAGSSGLTLSLFLTGYALTPLIGGPLADRFGRRPVLLISLILFTLAAAACGLSTNFGLLLACRIVQGCASGVSTTMPLAIVSDLLQGHIARQRISEITTINSIMPIVAPVFGSSMMMLQSWRIVFVIQAVFAACIIAVLLLDFDESLPAASRLPLHLGSVARSYFQLLTNRVFVGYSLIYALTFACMFSFVSVSPLLLMHRLGVTRTAYTFLFSFIATGTILGSMGSALLSRRHTSVHRVITCGLVLMSIASAVAATLQLAGFHRVIAVLPLVFLIFFAFGLTGPAVTLEALGPLPDLAGSGSGALRSIFRIFGSCISGMLTIYCAHHLMHSEVATTVTMFTMALTALLLYLVVLCPATHFPWRRLSSSANTMSDAATL